MNYFFTLLTYKVSYLIITNITFFSNVNRKVVFNVQKLFNGYIINSYIILFMYYINVGKL